MFWFRARLSHFSTFEHIVYDVHVNPLNCYFFDSYCACHCMCVGFTITAVEKFTYVVIYIYIYTCILQL